MVKYFKNKKTNEELRWDSALFRTHSQLLTGRAGKNHWHRINTNSDLAANRYLNRKGEPCSILSNESFIAPENQDTIETKLISIEQDENSLNETLKNIIQIFDLKTENWFHDAIINSISDSNSLSLEIIHSRDNELITSFFEFIDTKITSHTPLSSINGSEIFLIKIWSISPMQSRLIFILSDNSEFQIDFTEFKYIEK